MTLDEARADLIDAATKARDTSEILDTASMRYPRAIFSALHEAVRNYQQALLEAEG